MYFIDAGLREGHQKGALLIWTRGTLSGTDGYAQSCLDGFISSPGVASRVPPSSDSGTRRLLRHHWSSEGTEPVAAGYRMKNLLLWWAGFYAQYSGATSRSVVLVVRGVLMRTEPITGPRAWSVLHATGRVHL